MEALEGMQKSWKTAGHPAGDLYATAWTCGCVLAEGEPVDSPRAVAQAGPRAAVLLHRAADFDMEAGRIRLRCRRMLPPKLPAMSRWRAITNRLMRDT